MPESLPQAYSFIEKETVVQVFSCEFCEISKNTFFTKHLWVTATVSGVLCGYYTILYDFWYSQVQSFLPSFLISFTIFIFTLYPNLIHSTFGRFLL